MADGNEIIFNGLLLSISARGAVTYLVGGAIALLLMAFAWRVVRR